MKPRGRTTGNPMRWLLLRPRLGLALTLLLLIGCRSTSRNSGLVEAELRTREREVRNLRGELDRVVTFNSALQSELYARQMTEGLPIAPGAVIDSPQVMMGSMVKQITLGRGTGGLDRDGVPGDEALQVVIVPQDADGSAVKVPGTAIITAFEVTSEGVKLPLSRWEVPPLQMQKSWRSGLFATGYSLELPWQKWPSSERLRIVVQFYTLPNNRPFEVDKDITVKMTPLGPGLMPTPPVAPPKASLPPIIPDGPVLPPMPAAPGSKELLPPPAEGPILTPGAFLRQNAPNMVEAAKPPTSASGYQPVRLHDPQPKPEVDSPDDGP